MFNLIIKNFSLYYYNFCALKNINLKIKEKNITAMIGPSGCGKSTLLRSINRINDTIKGVFTKGNINVLGKNIYNTKIDVEALRRNVGMVFQRPNPFPLSIYENISFGLNINNKNSINIKMAVKESLKDVLLWDDVKNKLNRNALNLTLEQQQRLCIARAIIMKPNIILFDEPCSSLDPIATQRIEELILTLKKEYTVIIVTHNMQQAARISCDTAFMLQGKLIEFNKTEKIFTNPMEKETENYITGRFG
ncbi:MAG: phosphate ABC transporter ATP-binding protein PstB [Endomicrobium sp.]|jgi:phosphate transport system ATP-binding protein|nr:phosphate ABC transporter ATP-binding protein PstB [Endomicrobium sp.]